MGMYSFTGQSLRNQMTLVLEYVRAVNLKYSLSSSVAWIVRFCFKSFTKLDHTHTISLVQGKSSVLAVMAH